MKRTKKYIIRGLAGLAVSFCVLWIIGAIYVATHEEQLLQKVSGVISDRTRGDVKIGGLSVGLLRTFPNLSLHLSDIVVRDSLYAIHREDLLKARDIYLSFSLPAMLTGRFPVSAVRVRDGRVHLLTDSTGYSNEYVLAGDKDSSRSRKPLQLPRLVFHDVTVIYTHALRHKHHQVVAQHLRCTVKDDGRIVGINIHADILVNGLGFNTEKGSYLRDKKLEGGFQLRYDKSTRDLMVDRVRLDLDDHPFFFDGKFHIDKVMPVFNLSISTKQIDFSRAAALMTDSAAKKMLGYSFSRPVDLDVNLSGLTLYKFIPLVNVKMEVKQNDLTTPQGLFEDCSFLAEFNNEIKAGQPRRDENSMIRLSDFSGRWEKIRMQSKSARIYNLTHPLLECDLAASVDLESLNSLAGSAVLKFEGGTAQANIVFKGPISGRDSVVSNINGNIQVQGASFRYLPRNFLLRDCSGTLQFRDNNLTIDDLKATAGNTRLQMSAVAHNFLSMLDIHPEKLVLKWNIFSPHIRLADFTGFLAPARAAEKGKRDSARFGRTAAKIDKMFSDGTVDISLATPLMDYKAFSASDVKGELLMRPGGISLEKLTLHHAGGSMFVKGSLEDGAEYNPVTLQVQMNSMDIPQLFRAFNNFGQQAVTYENLQGEISANIALTTAVTNDAAIVRRLSKGTLDFIIKDGELNNFAPLEAVAETAFKKQDFKRIQFGDLSNRLEIEGTAFIINAMEIRSTALNLLVEGVYDVEKGTDMSIRLPVQNFTRSQANTDLKGEGKGGRGIGLRLRARTAEDGKLKISWDPFRRAVRNKEAVKDSATQAQDAD